MYLMFCCVLSFNFFSEVAFQSQFLKGPIIKFSEMYAPVK